MGMGTLNKLVLHFPNVFWDQVDFLGHAGKDRRKWLLFMDMSRVSGRPILVAMSGGPFAVLSERFSDTDITRRAMDVIRSVYPGAPDPVSSQATRWKTSKFSRGSFSFIPPGCRSARVFSQRARDFRSSYPATEIDASDSLPSVACFRWSQKCDSGLIEQRFPSRHFHTARRSTTLSPSPSPIGGASLECSLLANTPPSTTLQQCMAHG